MDISSLKLDPAGVQKTLVTLPDNSVVTTTGCQIHIPESFRGRDLMSMGVEITALGYFPIILPDGRYCRNMSPAMFRMTPAKISNIEINGKSYYELTFTKGSVLFKTKELFKDDIILYGIFDEHLSRGRIPWCYGYKDMGRFFKSQPKYTGRTLVPTHSIGEMFVAQMTRQTKDMTKPYRLMANNLKENRSDFEFIALRNVQYGANDTLSRIGGALSQDGFDAAIVNPTESVKPIESLMRM